MKHGLRQKVCPRTCYWALVGIWESVIQGLNGDCVSLFLVNLVNPQYTRDARIQLMPILRREV